MLCFVLRVFYEEIVSGFIVFVITSCVNPTIYMNEASKKEYDLPDKIIDTTKLNIENMSGFNAKYNSSDIKSWFKYNLFKNHKIIIDSITVANTTQRVDDKGNSEINPDYSNPKDLILNINGKFDKDVVKPDNILFKNEANLIQLSYVGEILPRTKILINDSIILEPVSATTTQIKVKLNTSFIPDFYLRGTHKFSILSDRDRTDTLIKIGSPENPKTSLSPKIDEVKIIRKKDIYFDINNLDFAFKTQGLVDDILELAKYNPDASINIKIKGKNLPVFYKFTYSTIDSKFGFGHSTSISKDNEGNIIWESIIHIPDPKEFEKKTSHILTYSTPFGTVIKRF